MTCPEFNDPDIPEKPELSAILAHILADTHNISEAVARLETIVAEFAPLARQAKSRFVLKSIGRR